MLLTGIITYATHETFLEVEYFYYDEHSLFVKKNP